MPAIGLVVLGLAMYMVEPIYVGAVAEQFGFTSRQLGLLVGAEIGASLMLSITAPLWINRIDLRRAGMLAIGAVAAGNFLSLEFHAFLPLLLCRMVTGFFGSGLAYTLGVRIIAAAPNPVRAFSWTITAQIAFGALGLMIFPLAIARWGLDSLLWTWLAFSLLFLPALVFLPRRIPVPNAELAQGGHRGSVTALALLAILAVWNFALGAVWAFIERIGRGMNLSIEEVGYGLSISMAVGILGSMQASWMSDRYGTRWQMPFMIAVHLGLFAALSGNLTPAEFLLVLIVFNYSWNLANPYLLAHIAKSDESGKLVALIPACQTAGNMIGPVVAGLLIGGAHYDNVLWLAMASYVVIMLPLLWVYMRRPADISVGGAAVSTLPGGRSG